MNRTPITTDTNTFPDSIRPLLSGTKLYDSSCSRDANVIYVERDGGYYLKSSAKGTLEKEALMTRFFHGKGLAAEVIAYESTDRDYLFTRAVSGEDGTHRAYLSEPRRLTDTFAEALRKLHEQSVVGCPVSDRMSEYLSTVKANRASAKFDLSLFGGDMPTPAEFRFTSADEAWQTVRSNAKYFRTDTLIHGDYCLPNVMFDDFAVSGFIDLGNGGVADRHIDVFWGVWTLIYNLKTDKYTARFLDAYGRDKVELDMLRTVAAAEIFG